MTPFRLSFGVTAKSPQSPTQGEALTRVSNEFCIHCCPFPPFQTGAPPRASQGQPAKQLSHSSSSTQGGRAGLCSRQMVSALCNTLGQGRYFQKGFLVVFFLYFIFSISHFILLYWNKKANARLGTRRVISPFWKAAMSRWGRQQATSQLGLTDAQGRL